MTPSIRAVLRGTGGAALAALAASVALIACSVCCESRADKPTGPIRNVILISIDTLRADHLGAYGYHLPTSPNLDAFAAAAVRFSDCHSASGHTLSSHKSLLSGRYASAFLESFSSRGGPRRATSSSLDYYRLAFALWPSPGLAQLLRGAGYATRGWTDGGNVRALYGFGIGFDAYEDERTGLRAHRLEAEAWIRENGQRPFFLFLHGYDVHCPYDPPRAFLDLFEPSCTGRLQFKGHCGNSYFNTLDLTVAEKAHIVRHYDAGIRHADDEVGKFLDFLRTSGRFQDTIIVITSDHGESLGERDFVGHGELYDDQIRVPLMIAAPGYAPGVVDAPVSGIDVAPTLLDLALSSVPDGLDGWSLKGLLGQLGQLGKSGATPPSSVKNDAVAGARDDAMAGVRVLRSAAEFERRPRFSSITVNEGRDQGTHLRKIALQTGGGMKLIWDLESGRRELYDLAGDPGELRNLAGSGRPEEENLAALVARHDSGALEGLDASAPKRGEDEPLTPELEEELRSLGYLR